MWDTDHLVKQGISFQKGEKEEGKEKQTLEVKRNGVLIRKDEFDREPLDVLLTEGLSETVPKLSHRLFIRFYNVCVIADLLSSVSQKAKEKKKKRLCAALTMILSYSLVSPGNRLPYRM